MANIHFIHNYCSPSACTSSLLIISKNSGPVHFGYACIPLSSPSSWQIQTFAWKLERGRKCTHKFTIRAYPFFVTRIHREQRGKNLNVLQPSASHPLLSEHNAFLPPHHPTLALPIQRQWEWQCVMRNACIVCTPSHWHYSILQPKKPLSKETK